MCARKRPQHTQDGVPRLPGSTLHHLHSYLVPLVLRMALVGKRFQQGPINLGPWSTPINVAAILWAAFVCVLLLLPQVRKASTPRCWVVCCHTPAVDTSQA